MLATVAASLSGHQYVQRLSRVRKVHPASRKHIAAVAHIISDHWDLISHRLPATLTAFPSIRKVFEVLRL